MKPLTTVFSLALCLLLVACSAPGNTRQEQKAHIDSMRGDVLSKLYKEKPDAKNDIRNAAGYAVFSNVNVYLLFVSAGNGFGVAVDNRSGKKTYMKMGEAGVGLGAGAKDYRVVFVFGDRAKFNDFVEKGWTFGGQADAAAKADKKGAAVGGELLVEGVKVYQLTDTGLALQATVKGTKYWQDDELNR
jgi:lipid-binding SYLF domain-containing protein